VSHINVLYLIRTWALGGSHTIIRLLLKHMPRERYRIITVPFDAPGDGDRAFIESVRRQGDDVAPERIPWQSRTQWFRARQVVAELIEKYNIDLIHTHDTHSNVLVGLGRKRWKCACVASPYGWWEPWWHVQAKIYHWVEKNLALPNFDCVYTVSQDMKQKILQGRTRPERIHVIHTGLDLDAMARGASREAVRAQFAIPDDAVVVGTVSRLFYEKGHKYLLKAVASLAGRYPNLYALIVGTGDQRDALEDLAHRLSIRDRIVFTGFYDDLSGALRAMDIFAQPSILHEGFPTAVLEAQAMGLPVVASDIGGTRETLAPGKTGLLVPPRDSAALADALETLLRDVNLRKRMAEAARPFIEQSFTLAGMIERMSRMYDEALEHYSHARMP